MSDCISCGKIILHQTDNKNQHDLNLNDRKISESKSREYLIQKDFLIREKSQFKSTGILFLDKDTEISYYLMGFC